MVENNNLRQAKKVLSQLVRFIEELWQMGITEDTFNFHTNYGIDASGKMIQVDVGEFHHSKTRLYQEMKNKIILQKESYQWLQKKSPELAIYLTALMNKITIP